MRRSSGRLSSGDDDDDVAAAAIINGVCVRVCVYMLKQKKKSMM